MQANCVTGVIDLILWYPACPSSILHAPAAFCHDSSTEDSMSLTACMPVLPMALVKFLALVGYFKGFFSG